MAAMLPPFATRICMGLAHAAASALTAHRGGATTPQLLPLMRALPSSCLLSTSSFPHASSPLSPNPSPNASPDTTTASKYASDEPSRGSAAQSASATPFAASTESQPTPDNPTHTAPSPTSRRDAKAGGSAADTVYPSSHDDNLGVQRNWFNALFSQLNVVHRTGLAPAMKGRQKEIFVAVEREFEGLWERHVKDKGLQGTAHRGMLLCCLAVATHRVLRYESGDDELVREIVRTNLGGMAVGVMMRLHKARLWLLLKLLNEDPYKQAVQFLPTLQGDLGSLVPSAVEAGPAEAVWTTSGCAFHKVLEQEGALELLPEFCCQYSMQWMEEFAQYGVRVGLEKSLAFDDDCCLVRISRPGGVAPPATQE